LKSLRHLRVLCVSELNAFEVGTHRRVAEVAEITQGKLKLGRHSARQTLPFNNELS